MWTVEESVLKLQRRRMIIHLFQKILDEVSVVVELIRPYSLHVALVVPFFLEDEFSKEFGQDEGGIVTRG